MFQCMLCKLKVSSHEKHYNQTMKKQETATIINISIFYILKTELQVVSTCLKFPSR